MMLHNIILTWYYVTFKFLSECFIFYRRKVNILKYLYVFGFYYYIIKFIEIRKWGYNIEAKSYHI
jgi:hypothetical protein